MDHSSPHRGNDVGPSSGRLPGRPLKRRSIHDMASPSSGPAHRSTPYSRPLPYGSSTPHSPMLGSSPSPASSVAPAAPAPTVVVPPGIMLPPVDLQGRRTVIDLTADDQPEVIDVDALPDRPNSYFGEDINVIYARRVQQHQHQMRNPAPVDPIEPYFIEPRSRPMPNLGNPIMMGGARVGSQIGNGDIGRRPGSNELVGEFVRALLPGMLPGMREWLGSPLRNAGGPWTYRHQSIDINFQAPGNLDYRLGPNGREFTPPVNEAARQRELEYKAPVKCQEGFTRDPKEDELLVCPGCDAELGVTSKENEAQGTVWVGKCGHCYCGNCAKAYKSAIPRGAKKTRICAIDKCEQTLTRKNCLWEVFL